MSRVQSIKVRLSIVFAFFFLLVLALGWESLGALQYSNDVSAQIRLRWLPSTGALDDLNNLTTDYPAAESDYSRAVGIPERAAVRERLAVLDRGIAAARRAYAKIPHDAAEDVLFRQFERTWDTYLASVAPSDATGMHASDTSTFAYQEANTILTTLTQRNIDGAKMAGEHSETAYLLARRRILATIALVGLLVLGAVIYVTRSLSEPLVRLAGLMHRLASNDVDIDVQDARRQDEIGAMARAVRVFRSNAIDLAHSRQALADQAAVLQEKLAAEQRIAVLHQNFVSMASHEFRTPLAIIDGHAQRLNAMRHRLTADEVQLRAQKMRNAVHRMTVLIENLMSSARLTDGRMDLAYLPGRVDLTVLLRNVCQAQQSMTPDAEIIPQLGSKPLFISGESNLLTHLFSNLLSNAVKYSREGGIVNVAAWSCGNAVSVSVQDKGIGIPAEDQARVFERYYRGNNTGGIEGGGIGLHLVKTIVDLHKGTIQLSSRIDEGTRFVVTLHSVEHRDSTDPSPNLFISS